MDLKTEGALGSAQVPNACIHDHGQWTLFWKAHMPNCMLKYTWASRTIHFWCLLNTYTIPIYFRVNTPQFVLCNQSYHTLWQWKKFLKWLMCSVYLSSLPCPAPWVCPWESRVWVFCRILGNRTCSGGCERVSGEKEDGRGPIGGKNM